MYDFKSRYSTLLLVGGFLRFVMYNESKGVISMNNYISGEMIKKLRERDNLTQTALAEILCVSDKTISKWETGKGYPDSSLIQPIANAFNISVTELFSGCIVENKNVNGNMLRSNFYICPICGNVIHSMGQVVASCHGVNLVPEMVEEVDHNHTINIETVEDEYFVSLNHPMTKGHYISFIAGVSCDRIQLVKLYPEGNAEVRFKKSMVKYIYYYCNKDGLFRVKI